MTWTEFLTRFQAADAEINAYVAGLPLWVNVWRGWMFFIFTAALIFVIWKREARWLALTMILSTLAYNAVVVFTGVGRFPSIAFVLLWTPLLVYLARRLPHLARQGRFDRFYRAWVVACVATLSISLAFDVYNVAYALVVDGV